MGKTPAPLVAKLSKIISNFFNPLTSLFIFFIYANLQRYTYRETAFLFFPLLLIIVIPVSLWIFWNVKKGKYADMDVSNRDQRKGLYFVIAGALLAFLSYDYFFQKNIDITIIFLLILLLTLQMSNYFIKSSMHTAFNVFVAALFFAINPVFGMMWFGIAVLVGITRIILKRHTLKEVFTGALIAILVSFIYLYANIKIQS